MNEVAKNYISEIKQILAQARQKAYAAVNFAMVEAYWQIGRRIVEEEQQGKARADYGAEIVKNLSIELTKEFGKGFSERSILYYRQFYLMTLETEIPQSVIAESENTDSETETIPRSLIAELQQVPIAGYLQRLSWTHIQRIMRVSDPKARNYYFKETVENNWSVRTLDRNIATLYYQRLLSSQQKEPVINEMQEKTKAFQNDKLEFIKNPSVLEFLGLPDNAGYTESELEQAIINQMQKFLLELGKGLYALSSYRRGIAGRNRARKVNA